MSYLEKWFVLLSYLIFSRPVLMYYSKYKIQLQCVHLTRFSNQTLNFQGHDC